MWIDHSIWPTKKSLLCCVSTCIETYAHIYWCQLFINPKWHKLDYPFFVIRILGMAPGEMLHRAKGAFSLGGGNLAQTIKGGPPAIRHF